MKKKSFYLLLIMPLVLISISSCKKTNPTGEDYYCTFCGKEFPDEVSCSNHMLECLYYDANDEIPETAEYSHWMSHLPDTMLFDNLTIPGMHDAATYSYNSAVRPQTMKDQDTHYKDAWKCGVRAFDMRLGYDHMVWFHPWDDYCKFFHGGMNAGIVFRVTPLRSFENDIKNYFPDPDQLNGECMILIVKEECQPPSSVAFRRINVFDCLIRKLLDKYSSSRFIAYRPGLQLKDVRGKIMILTRTELYYTQRYDTIEHKQDGRTFYTPQIPLTYISSFPDNTSGWSDLKPYYCSDKGHSYSVFIHDHYDIGVDADPKKKFDSFTSTLQDMKRYHNGGHNPSTFLSIVGMNAIQGCDSWDVCEYMHKHVNEELRKDPLPNEYCQPLGIVLGDFMACTKYSQNEFVKILPDGINLTHLLVDQNKRWRQEKK